MPQHRPILGIYLSLGAFFFFALQDASVKWLVASYAVAQVLFIRSLSIVTFLTIRSRGRAFAELAVTPHRLPLFSRGVLLFLAWLLYYTASRQLALAELTTIYYASPILVTVLSIALLGERVPGVRWVATAIGFTGVIVACLPRDTSHFAAVALAFGAAVLWAFSMTLMRSIAHKVTSRVLMMSQNLTLLVACGFAVPFLWQPVSPWHLMLMVSIGVMGGTGQFLMFEAARLAPASVVAPMEYSSLLWSFALGFLIWGDIPPANVFAGGFLIIAGGVVLYWSERRRIIAALRDGAGETPPPALSAAAESPPRPRS